MIRKGEWKLIHYWEDGKDELYNLSKDPAEIKDVLKSNRSRANSLRKELDIFLANSKIELPKLNPNFDAIASKKMIENRKEKMIKRLEKRRKEILNKDFKPNENWYKSSLTKD